MDLRRLRAGEWITALSGIALLVSLFLPWYGYVPRRPRGPIEIVGGDVTGWQAFAITDVLLTLLASFGVALLVVTATQRTVAVPIALAGLTALAGSVALVLAVVRLLVEVSPESPAGALVDTTRRVGSWLGVAAAAGLAIGGWMAMRDERPSRPGETRDATGRPVPPPPEPETIAAPRS
jgi:hypothetical protein